MITYIYSLLLFFDHISPNWPDWWFATYRILQVKDQNIIINHKKKSSSIAPVVRDRSRIFHIFIAHYKTTIFELSKK